MESSSFPTSLGSRTLPPALGYSGAALALWIFRRPILALTGLLVHLAFSLIKPALLILGTVKLAGLLQASRKAATSPVPSQSTYPGDDEALLVPARAVALTSQTPSAGLEV